MAETDARRATNRMEGSALASCRQPAKPASGAEPIAPPRPVDPEDPFVEALRRAFLWACARILLDDNRKAADGSPMHDL
ncbi:MAG: hypothetical protein IT186_15965 [Acidobacteria bacterium]|nr:hypothetical protein [Acidobacteriota bacterium]